MDEDEQEFLISDLWSLDITIARFVLPRLKKFKEINYTYPGDTTAESWDSELSEMIWAFEQLLSEQWPWLLDEDDHTRIQNALELFGKRFTSLWY